MADDPNKRHQDGWTVSFVQTYEYNYFRSEMQKEFPFKTESEIDSAMMECRREIAPSEGREKLKDCVRRRLRGY